MQFNNEPEGWDDHIIQSPPCTKAEPKISFGASSALAVVAGIIGFAAGALGFIWFYLR
jgi:hypothetical protein